MPTEPRSSRLEPMPTSVWYTDTIFTRLAAYTCACARAHSQPYARARANGSGRGCESLRPPRAARGLRSTGLLNAYEDLDTRLRVLYRPRDRPPCGIFPFTFVSWIFFFFFFFFYIQDNRNQIHKRHFWIICGATSRKGKKETKDSFRIS